jgi:hypothetical protein
MSSQEERVEWGSDIVFTAVKSHIRPITGEIEPSVYPGLLAAKEALRALRFPEEDIEFSVAYGIECAQDAVAVEREMALQGEWGLSG